MAPSAIVNSLSSLLPSHNIPAKLITHAESLVSLSRQRAANLKSDEEIARTHACAEIACKRLRVQLRLSNVKSGAGAPTKPAVYKKLVAYLDRVLGDGQQQADVTPRGKKRSSDANELPASSAKRARTGTNNTPTKNRTATNATPSKFVGTIDRGTFAGDSSDRNETAPKFVMPYIRRICRALSTPSLVPHVYTGTSIVLGLALLWPVSHHESEEAEIVFKSEVLTLTAALYLTVLTRMQKGKMTTNLYDAICTKSIDLVGQISTTDGFKDRIDQWIERINTEEWASRQEWFDNVPENTIHFSLAKVQTDMVDSNNISEDEEMQDLGNVDIAISPFRIGGHKSLLQDKRDEMRKELEQPDPEGVLLVGLGTMMQDALNYTSIERREDFKEWKNELLKKMALSNRGNSKKRKGKSKAVG